MTFLDLKGRKKSKSLTKYLVDWNGGTRSKGQTALKRFLYRYWSGDIVCEEFPVVGSKMTFDLINFSKKIIIEHQGIQHQKFVKHFHGSRVGKFLGQIKRDMKKHEWAELNGFSLVETYSEDDFTYEFFLDRGIELWARILYANPLV